LVLHVILKYVIPIINNNPMKVHSKLAQFCRKVTTCDTEG
jgi:hypothetical protein